MKKALTTLLFVATSLSVGGEVAYADPLCYFDSPDGTRIDLSTWCGRGSTSAPLTSDMTTTVPSVTTPNPSNIFQASITQIRRAQTDERGRSKEAFDWYISGTLQSSASESIPYVTVYLDTFRLFEGKLRKVQTLSQPMREVTLPGQSYSFTASLDSFEDIDVVKITRVTGVSGSRSYNESRAYACYPERYCNRTVLGEN